MFRALALSASFLALSSCVSNGAGPSSEILARAEADTQLRNEIDAL